MTPQFVDARDGTRIAFECTGTGTPVALLHGLTEDSHSWDGIFEALAADHRVVRLDQRGHGRSAPVVTASLDDLASDVEAVVTHVGIERPVLIGHSLGAAVACAYARGHPVSAVVNVDQPMRFAALAAVVRSFEPDLRSPRFVETMVAIAEALGASELSEERQRIVRAYRERIAPSLVLSIWDPLFSAETQQLEDLSRGLLERLSAPFLSIHGDDPGAGYVPWLKGLVAQARVELWPGNRHWLHVADPRRFVARMSGFLAAECA